MNVFLVGGSGSLMNQLIKKMSKEGHRVSILTGSHFRQDWYERVFERYDFPYDSLSIPEVFESVAPDVTVFLGAYDTNFRWDGSQGDSVRLVAGVMNLLSSFAGLRRGRFLFLSSEAAFSDARETPIGEEEHPDASDLRGMAFTQCEELCESFRHSRNLDIVTLRLGGCYHLPKKLGEVNDRVSRMCLDALAGRPLNPAANRRFSLIYEADAVQFISQIALAKELAHTRYQLAVTDTGEEELAQLVQEKFEEIGWADRRLRSPKVRVSPERTAAPSTLILPSSNFREEFGMRRTYDLAETVEEIARYMLRHREVFLQDQEVQSPFKRFLQRFSWLLSAIRPFAENLACFLLILLVQRLTASSEIFSRLDFSLLYVLLFSIVYGQQQATVSAILSTFSYLLLQMQSRSGFDVLLDYSTYIWIAQLFIVGLAVGYLKDRLNVQRDEAREDHSYMAGQIDDIKEINSSNVRVKDAMQTQIINQSDSIGKIYSVTSTLDQYNYDEVLFYAAEILKQIMGSEDVSIYTVSGGAYARMFTATSPLSRKLGNSVKIQDLEGLHDALANRQVYINRGLDERYPMMAGAIYEENELRLILMVWTLPWEKMTLGQADLLAVTGALIQNAALRANRYLEAIHQERFVGKSPVLAPEAFKSLLSVYQNAERRSLTDFSVLRIECGEQSKEELSEAMVKKIRPNDYLGELREEDTCLYALLTNTDNAAARIVEERLGKAGFLCRQVDEFREME